MVLILSSQTLDNTPELDASFHEADAMPSSVTSGFLHLVITFADNYRLQLPPSIKYHKLWCKAIALLLLIPQVGEISASQ